jgi:hypothetical protein
LLDANSFRPNPDFFAARLWRRMMGERVLAPASELDGEAGVGNGAPAKALRIYAHCTDQWRNKGGITLLLINLHEVDAVVVLELPQQALSSRRRREYHMKPPHGASLSSRVVALNGKPLRKATEPLLPRVVDGDAPLIIAARSYAFIGLPEARVDACE